MSGVFVRRYDDLQNREAFYNNDLANKEVFKKDPFDVHCNMVDVHMSEIFKASFGNSVDGFCEWKECGWPAQRRLSALNDMAHGAITHIKSVMGPGVVKKKIIGSELFVCEMMHNVSMCIADDSIRKSFVDEFRSRFTKQVVLASYVVGPLIREHATIAMTKEVSCFLRIICANAKEKK